MSSVHEWIDANRDRAVEELIEFLRIPSISTDPERSDDMRRCADWLARRLGGAGFTRTEVIPTGGHPVVWGEWMGAPGKPTILLYGHYDVQPVDPLELWETPPFEPSVRDGNLFARGSSDDKGQIFMHVMALESYLRQTGRLPVNVRILFEGEEEIGSEHLTPFIRKQRERLAADVAVVSDTAMFAKGIPSLTYGLRGLCYMQVEVTGPRRDLHSGSYGGASRNPLLALATILSGLQDRDGRVTIPGFYDSVRPLLDEERREFASLNFDEDGLRKEMGVEELWGESGYTVLERMWARPTLDVHGLWGGFQGAGAKTVIPSHCGAKVSMRLVPDQDSAAIGKLFTEHARRLCPPGIQLQVSDVHGANAVIVPLDHPAIRAASRAIEKAFGRAPVKIREGGSIPVVGTFKELLGMPTVLAGVGLPDDAAHAPNEKFHLENFHGGIHMAAYLYEELAGM
jgi:acetylornithine deacetylase/succinyl-diaminopimelate desuccinylase-like protein